MPRFVRIRQQLSVFGTRSHRRRATLVDRLETHRATRHVPWDPGLTEEDKYACVTALPRTTIGNRASVDIFGDYGRRRPPINSQYAGCSCLCAVTITTGNHGQDQFCFRFAFNLDHVVRLPIFDTRRETRDHDRWRVVGTTIRTNSNDRRPSSTVSNKYFGQSNKKKIY